MRDFYSAGQCSQPLLLNPDPEVKGSGRMRSLLRSGSYPVKIESRPAGLGLFAQR